MEPVLDAFHRLQLRLACFWIHPESYKLCNNDPNYMRIYLSAVKLAASHMGDEAAHLSAVAMQDFLGLEDCLIPPPNFIPSIF